MVASRRATFAAVLLLLAAGVWAYGTSVNGVFVLDDTSAIAWNASIRHMWPLTSPLSPPAGTTVSGRPVANLTFAINYALAPADARDVFAPRTPAGVRDETFDRNVWGYHAVNLAIHLAAGLVLFGVVRRTLATRWRVSPAITSVSSAIALLWIVHPLQTSSVTYVIQRVESLMGLFYLLTLYCAIRSIQSGSRVFGVLAVVACALGMATKESMVTAPVMVWVWERTFRKAVGRRPWAIGRSSRSSTANGLWPLAYCLGLASTWLILMALQLSHPRGATVSFSAHGWTPWTYLLTQSQVILQYVRLAVMPSPLVFSYTWPMVTSVADVWPQLLGLATLAIVTTIGIVGRRPVAFLGAWFLITLAPSSSVVPIVTEIAAEQRMYLPLAAVIAAGVLGVFWIGRRVFGERSRVAAVAGIAIALAATIALGATTRDRNRVYWSDETLWRDTLDKQPNNARAHAAYAADLFMQHRYGEADLEAHVAVRLDDSNAFAQNTLAASLLMNGRIDEAEVHLTRALEIWPYYVDARKNLADVYARRHDDVRAIAEYSRALEVVPDNPALLVACARLLATSSVDAARDGARAVAMAERAVSLTGGRDLAPIETLAAAYAEADRFDDAIALLGPVAANAPASTSQRLQDELALFRAHQKIRR